MKSFARFGSALLLLLAGFAVQAVAQAPATAVESDAAEKKDEPAGEGTGNMRGGILGVGIEGGREGGRMIGLGAVFHVGSRFAFAAALEGRRTTVHKSEPDEENAERLVGTGTFGKPELGAAGGVLFFFSSDRSRTYQHGLQLRAGYGFSSGIGYGALAYHADIYPFSRLAVTGNVGFGWGSTPSRDYWAESFEDTEDAHQEDTGLLFLLTTGVRFYLF
jgi:hypothetical protein